MREQKVRGDFGPGTLLGPSQAMELEWRELTSWTMEAARKQPLTSPCALCLLHPPTLAPAAI